MELAAFLAELDDQDEERFAATVTRRMAAMDSNEEITMEAFEAEHHRRASEGK